MVIGSKLKNETPRPDTSCTQIKLSFAGLYPGIDFGEKSLAFNIAVTLLLSRKHRKDFSSYSRVVQNPFYCRWNTMCTGSVKM